MINFYNKHKLLTYAYLFKIFTYYFVIKRDLLDYYYYYYDKVFSYQKNSPTDTRT